MNYNLFRSIGARLVLDQSKLLFRSIESNFQLIENWLVSF